MSQEMEKGFRFLFQRNVLPSNCLDQSYLAIYFPPTLFCSYKLFTEGRAEIRDVKLQECNVAEI